MKRASWIKRAAVALVVLVGLRIVLALAAHPVASMVAAGRGLELGWDSHALSLSRGSLELRGLACGAEGAAPFLEVERMRVDIGLRALLSSKIVIQELEVDGLRLSAGVDPEGRLRLGGGFDPARLAGDPTAAEAGSAPSKPFLLPALLPLELQRARVRHAKFDWRDEGEGGESETLEFELEADRLLVAGASGRAVARASARGLLDGARLELRTRVEPDESDPRVGRTNLELDAQLSGLRAPRVANHLRRLGVVARGERIDGALGATLELVGTRDDGDASRPRTAAKLALRQATISGDGVEAASLAAASLDIQGVPGRLQFGLARLDGPRARIVLQPDGIVSFAGLGFDATRVQAAGNDPSVPPSTTPEDGIELVAAGFELAGGRVEFVDARAVPPRVHALEDGALRLDASEGDAADELAARLVASARIPGVARAIEASVEGALGSAARLALVAKAEQVDLASFADLLAPLGLAPASRPADLTARLALSGRRTGAGWVFDGRVDDLSARDGVHALAAGAIAMEGLSLGDEGVVVESLAWREVEVDARRSADGALHLPLVVRTGAPTAGAPAAVASANPPGSSVPLAALALRIGKLELGARRL
ncbi:MAG: AsmA family, partial [Planctomycetota bacterium]